MTRTFKPGTKIDFGGVTIYTKLKSGQWFGEYGDEETNYLPGDLFDKILSDDLDSGIATVIS